MKTAWLATFVDDNNGGGACYDAGVHTDTQLATIPRGTVGHTLRKTLADCNNSSCPLFLVTRGRNVLLIP